MSGRPLLSLVIVCYEMERELPRTLLSLSPPYQQGIAESDYEIIVVDNGSRCPPLAEGFRHFHRQLRIVSCSRPTPSPVRALNEGLALSTGEVVGMWIDGARMASPGLLSATVAASRLHPRPVIATLNYQLGPARQLVSAGQGYDRAAEDRVLSNIGWPSNGYELFGVATPEIAEPTAPMLESNALFMPRTLWDELGGYDEAFAAPGGGMANPDVFVRAVGLADTQLIRILGEGTFHQIHGGMTTGSQQAALDYVKQASRDYRNLRGRPLAPVRGTGWLFSSQHGALVTGPGA